MSTNYTQNIPINSRNRSLAHRFQGMETADGDGVSQLQSLAKKKDPENVRALGYGGAGGS